MNTMNDVNIQLFKEEAGDLLNDLEGALLEAEARPSDTDLIARIFRALHTVKGSSGMFGFDAISRFLHNIETVFDHVRNGKLDVNKQLVNLTLAAADQVRKMLDGCQEESDQQVVEKIGQAYTALLQQNDSGAEKQPVSEDKTAVSEINSLPMTYRIRFSPSPDIFCNGTNPVLLLRELQELGTCHVVAAIEAIPDFGTFDPEKCYTSWDIILTTDRGADAIHDVFIFVEDLSRISIEVTNENDDQDRADLRLGEILVERGDADPSAVDEIVRSKKLIGEMIVESGVASRDSVVSALAEQEHSRQLKEKKRAHESVSSIRVASEKLDKLVNLVGELVIAEARLGRSMSSVSDTDLLSVAEDIERLTAELRDNAMGIRMVPVSNLFDRFKRLVHDLSSQLGKEVEIITKGGTTELDKTVIERLNDPLVHLIRNSIDHGIELPETRSNANKRPRGIVRLSARYAGAHVVIDIEDDGAGLDKKAIKYKAMDRGLLPQGMQLTDKEIFDLIFQPGFSTATQVSNVSGRGVGMDVVKRSVEALRGTIELKSTPGTGTTVSIRLPLTLAIVEGLLVAAGEEQFVVPVSLIQECVELNTTSSAAAERNAWANIRGALVPCVRLRDHFSIRGRHPAREQAVVVKYGDTTAGLVVDDIVGEIQAVIKGLGKMYQRTVGVSGATILGNGRIALILDVHQLIQSGEQSETMRIA